MFLDSESIDLILRAVILSATALAWIVILVKIVGLRAFSKMTSFDFVTTLAIGSLLAGSSQAINWPGFWQAMLAIGALLGVQFLSARARRVSAVFQTLIENKPILLMRDGKVLEDALKRSRIARVDLFTKLREANVNNLSQVRAVVLETTGDISVLHGAALSDDILYGVEHQ